SDAAQVRLTLHPSCRTARLAADVATFAAPSLHPAGYTFDRARATSPSHWRCAVAAACRMAETTLRAALRLPTMLAVPLARCGRLCRARYFTTRATRADR